MKQLIISGGIYKNHKITCPPGIIRPAMNLMREAVFQLIDNIYHLQAEDTSPITFLDLFSGSGLMSIEAVSRGISFAVAVEKDHKKWSTIHKNFSIDNTKFKLVKAAAEHFLLKTTIRFDIIYVDPPFNYPYKDDLMKKIINSRACTDQSMVIIHMPKKERTLAQSYGTFTQKDFRSYGGSAIYIYTIKE